MTTVLVSAPAARRELEWRRPDWQGLRAQRQCVVESGRWLRAFGAETSSLAPLTLRAGVRGARASSVLLRALATCSVSAVALAAARLAGLGEGSTPAGDDYLIGVMYAVRALLPADQAGPICTAIAEAATPRTTRLSAAWLQRASGGDAIPTWSFFVASLAQGNHDATLAATERVLALGHTSGRAALAGFLDVLELLGDHDA